ncbi:aminopeptidase N [Kangiella sp. TOML190]|uniref:aminopeptidase N n=1 Tax=Kangiella sp. TOML190 TaxID=2931351 RepID=UPI00203A8186|nr:aminopeptidase N [Kangiella sp. TOML190]
MNQVEAIDNQTKKMPIKYRKDYQASNFVIDSVELKVELLDGYSLVSATLAIRENLERAENQFKEKSSNSDLQLNGEQLELLKVAVDGGELESDDYQVSDKHLIIKNCPQAFSLTTQVKIYPDQNTSLEGLYRSSEKYCTQCEAEGFRKITYYLDRPDIMAVFTVRIEAKKALYPHLLSNGNKIDSGDLADGRHYAVWHDPFKKPAYLFALCAGDYDLLEDQFITCSNRQIALQIFVDKGKLGQCQHAMASLKKSMQWDQDVYGLEYDLDTYMVVAVGDFNMGAMENKGLNIFNTKYVLASQVTATDQDFEDVEAVIAHEYFHNWTGNRVTCRDWFQLSLKEGLTVFRDQQFTADQTDPAVKRISDVKIIRSHQFAEDAGPMAHPIRPDSYIEMNNFYTVTVYNKGAEIIRMYHTLLGEEGFSKGMNLYFQRHDGQAVTCEDFVKAMEDANDYPLAQFRRWYAQAGTPYVKVASAYHPEQKTLTLTIKQSCPDTPGQKASDKKAFHIPIKIGLLDNLGRDMPLQLEKGSSWLDGDILQLTESEQTFVFKNLGEKPVLSLLRNFSAPVRLDYDYSDEDLCFLFAKDSDAFNRWDAGQRLLTNIIWSLYEDSLGGKALTLPAYLVSAIKDILDNAELNGQFKALALALPDIKTLIETRARLELDHLLRAHQFVKIQIAQQLEMEWLLHYQANHHIGDFKHDQKAVSQRAFANRCLSYLLVLNKAKPYQLALKQLAGANNMTDAIAAFKALMHSDFENKSEVAEQFYQKWKDEDLVIDKWLSVLATAPSDDTIAQVQQLVQHPAFSLTNPNKVRALIGAFAGANLPQFHRKDGAGYKMLTKQIKALYEVNPQVAARLTGAFNRWKKFDDERQLLMKQQLEQILALPELSRDVYEIASKALN